MRGCLPTATRGGPDRAHATEADHRLAAELATQAGVLLVELRRQYRFDGAADPDTEVGADDWSRQAGGRLDGPDGPAADALRAEGDRLAHEFLAGALAEARPGDAVLSEEAPDDRRRLHAERVWIVDPLDGTRQYGEAGRGDWAVHVALVIDGVPVVGAVALPAEGVTFATPDQVPSGPPTDPGRAPAPTPRSDGAGRRRVIASRSRPSHHASAIAAAVDAELYTLGSVGAKVAEVVRGRADAYVHASGHHEWDSAAPVAVARAAGLHASRLGGGPLRYNQPVPFVPDVLICRPEIAGDIVAAHDAYESSARSGSAAEPPSRG